MSCTKLFSSTAPRSCKLATNHKTKVVECGLLMFIDVYWCGLLMFTGAKICFFSPVTPFWCWNSFPLPLLPPWGIRDPIHVWTWHLSGAYDSPMTISYYLVLLKFTPKYVVLLYTHHHHGTVYFSSIVWHVWNMPIIVFRLISALITFPIISNYKL